MKTKKTCIWIADESIYETSCKEAFEFTNGGVKENKFLFCPYCGGKIEAQP